MNTRVNIKIIAYSIASVVLSLMPAGFLYMLDVRGQNIFTIILKSLLKLISKI